MVYLNKNDKPHRADLTCHCPANTILSDIATHKRHSMLPIKYNRLKTWLTYLKLPKEKFTKIGLYSFKPCSWKNLKTTHTIFSTYSLTEIISFLTHSVGPTSTTKINYWSLHNTEDTHIKPRKKNNICFKMISSKNSCFRHTDSNGVAFHKSEFLPFARKSIEQNLKKYHFIRGKSLINWPDVATLKYVVFYVLHAVNTDRYYLLCTCTIYYRLIHNRHSPT